MRLEIRNRGVFPASLGDRTVLLCASQPTSLIPVLSRLLLCASLPFNVFTEKKFLEKLEYMHNNPVKKRLVSSPDQ
jgi:hypothetical protein